MHLVFPRSMIIPEILEHLEGTDFEDWLTAALIENASQLPGRDLCANLTRSSQSGIADLWMAEITERTGKVWRGKFQVDFTKEYGEDSQDMHLTEHRSGELFFALDIETAEITFNTVCGRRSTTDLHSVVANCRDPSNRLIQRVAR